MELKDCLAIVTGGASGLGEACVRELAKNGSKVCILDVSEDRGENLASELGDSVVFCKCDVTQEDDVQTAVDSTVKSFGGINIAINCAGIGPPAKVLSKKGPMPMDFFNNIVKINLMGTMNVIRLAAAKMFENTPNDENEKGVVINTSSGAAFDGQIGQAAYSASKAAIVGMTLPIAREFAGYGIRVVTIAPGVFDTPILAALSAEVKESLERSIPFPSRMGKPSEFAQLSRQIIENPYLNGTTIRIDASYRMPPR